MPEPVVSIFTPSHNPEWLHEVWETVQNQTYKNFEWVIVANGEQIDAVEATAKHVVGGDPRVRILRSTEKGIGALKRFACNNCVGDLLLELDHDDLLTYDCLQAVVGAAAKCPAAAFIFSDAVTCDFQHKSNVFQTAFGWRNYVWDYNGHSYRVNQSPPVTARSVSEILFAPDHVRVWTKAAYQISGGHDPKYTLADDHELIVRTYLKGIHFEHITRPLYIHRVFDDGNASVKHVQQIQKTSKETQDKYLHTLVREWCRRENLLMYDLGGVHDCPKGFIPIDYDPRVTAKGGLCLDLTKDKLAAHLPAGKVGCIRAFDFLEHIPGPQIPALMNDIYEALVPGGWLLTLTPAVCDNAGRAGRGAFQDPTHVSFWSSNNFWYYTDAAQAKYVPEIKCRFQRVRVGNGYLSEWHKTHLIPYVWADLVALKGAGYFPGESFI